MKKLSPLGICSIALFITHWNLSNYNSKKAEIRDEMLSDKVDLIQKALHDMRAIVKMSCRQNVRDILDYKILCKIAEALSESSIHDQRERETKTTLKKVEFEIIFHFTEMFKKGHLEKIPMPEFVKLDEHDLDKSPEEVTIHHKGEWSPADDGKSILPASEIRFGRRNNP